MIHVNTWRPDTCECEVTFEFDDELPLETRTHVIKGCRNCSVHNGVAVPLNATMENDRFAPAEQNRRKNFAHGHALNLIPEIADTLDDGSVALKKNVTLAWSWTGTGVNRVLTLIYTGASFPAGRKSALQAKCDTVFGVGKVIIG